MPYLPPKRNPPILASIGTVLIDYFEPPSTDPLATVSPIVPSLPSGTPTVPVPPIPSDPALTTTPNTFPAFSPISSTSSSIFSGSSGSTLEAQSITSSRPTTPQVIPATITIHPDAKGEIGGGALFALLGARVWLPASQLATLINRAPRVRDHPGESARSSSSSDSSVSDPANDMPISVSTQERRIRPVVDFPRELESKIEKFGNEMWVYKEAEHLQMATARISYDARGVRTYVHVVKPQCWSVEALIDTPLEGAEYLHIAPPFSPSLLASFVAELKSKPSWNPKIVFEPAPFSCHPGEVAALEAVAKDVHVLSPNHEELLSFYGQDTAPMSDSQIKSSVENRIRHLLDIGVGVDGSGIIVVRCGRLGACVGTRQGGGPCWIPAYFGADEQDRIKDVTGAGNAFLGGFVAGLVASNGDPFEATLYGTVSSSFMVEQVGLPVLERLPRDPASEIDGNIDRDTSGEEKVAVLAELWNSERPVSRLNQLRDRPEVLLARHDISRQANGQ